MIVAHPQDVDTASVQHTGLLSDVSGIITVHETIHRLTVISSLFLTQKRISWHREA